MIRPLDKSYDISALTNCGGFDERFLPVDLNEFGLVEDYEKAFEIEKRLLENIQRNFMLIQMG